MCRFMFIVSLLTTAAFGQSLPVLSTPDLMPDISSTSIPEIRDVGDTDGDGVADFVVTVSSNVVFGGMSTPQVRSGVDGGFRYNLTTGLIALGPLVIRVAGVGDLDGDGLGDIVAVERPLLATNQLLLRLFSGATGAPLWLADLIPNEPGFGASQVAGLERIGDQDGDGIADILVGITGAAPTGLLVGNRPARVRWLSGATGQLIHELQDPLAIIDSVAVAGDVDGDGLDDVVIGASTSPFVAPDAGGASLVSGADYSYRHFWNGAGAGDRFATGVAPVGDLDGDGLNDLLISVGVAGEVRAYSGVDASLIQIWSLGTSDPEATRLRARSAFDWNGDGRADFVFEDGNRPGVVVVRSGLDFAVLAEVDGAVVSDLNGDAVPDAIVRDTQGAIAIRVEAHLGAAPYGTGTDGRSLTWVPDAATPSQGIFMLEGGTPNAPVLIGGSAAFANEVIAGTSFPLLVSIAPANLFLQLNATLDAFGQRGAPVSLRQPALAGTVFYYQWAELGANPGVSNGLQLLFDQ